MITSHQLALAAAVTGLCFQSAVASGLSVDPRLVGGLSFGAAAPIRPTAELALDLPWRLVDGSLISAAQFDLSQAGPALRIGGVPLWRRDYRMAQNGTAENGQAPSPETPWYSHSWVYWTLGGLAATAAALSSLSSGGTEQHHLQVSSSPNSGPATIDGENGHYTVCSDPGVAGAPNTCVPVNQPFAEAALGASVERHTDERDWGTGGMGDLIAR